MEKFWRKVSYCEDFLTRRYPDLQYILGRVTELCIHVHACFIDSHLVLHSTLSVIADLSLTKYIEGSLGLIAPTTMSVSGYRCIEKLQLNWSYVVNGHNLHFAHRHACINPTIILSSENPIATQLVVSAETVNSTTSLSYTVQLVIQEVDGEEKLPSHTAAVGKWTW